MHIAIVGMGPAGVSAVQNLREQDREVEISMFSVEDTPPYSPPCLGNFLLTGKTKALFWQGKDFAERYKVQTYPGEKITMVQPQKKELVTHKNRTVTYDRLIIASGSSLYAPVPGSDKKRVLQFKNLAGARSLRELAGKRGDAGAVIVGGGFIGVEIAIYLSNLGISTTLLNRRGWVMPRLLDPETSAYVLADLHRQGVDVRLNTEGIEFAGEKEVEYLLTNKEEELRADSYIAATGVRPNIDFLSNSGVEVEQGILVDDYLQTSAADVFACGDVAQAKELITGRKEVLGLYPLAVAQGRIAARNTLGQGLRYEPEPNMNSLKGLGFKLMVCGRQRGEELVLQSKNGLKKFFVEQDRLKGFVLLGDVSDAGLYLTLLKQQKGLGRMKRQLGKPGIAAKLFTPLQSV